MMSQRVTAMESLHKHIQNQMKKMLYNKSTSFCTLPPKQAQCDSLNLGCLIQAFPLLCDPRAQSYAERCSISGTIDKIRHMVNHGREITFHQWGRSNNTGDHADCSLSKLLLPEAEKIMQSIEGLTLPPCCL
jgi:hypothetical protein